jgi:large subunit ribosomal protein L3
MTRGTHEVRRHIGAIGCRKFPGRVFKNKKMPGHMGAENVTVQNLQIVGVQPEKNLILVKGGIPGSKGGLVLIKRAIKSLTPREAA